MQHREQGSLSQPAVCAHAQGETKLLCHSGHINMHYAAGPAGSETIYPVSDFWVIVCAGNVHARVVILTQGTQPIPWECSNLFWVETLQVMCTWVLQLWVCPVRLVVLMVVYEHPVEYEGLD